jgi:hypothetical protein
MSKELTIAEQAEITRQEGLNMLAVGKVFPDAKTITFQGEKVYCSAKVNTNNFKGIEFIAENNSKFSQAIVSARLFHTVKRPGRPVIRVYSKNLYGFALNHIVRLVNEMAPKSVMGKIGHVLRSQESTRPMLKVG